jgi:hypothetical protein
MLWSDPDESWEKPSHPSCDMLTNNCKQPASYLGKNMRDVLKAIGKGLCRILWGATLPILGLIGIKRNCKVARDAYVYHGNRIPACDGEWQESEFLVRRYGITLRYAIITTFCAAAALGMGITDGICWKCWSWRCWLRNFRGAWRL